MTMNRRELLTKSAMGIGALALPELLHSVVSPKCVWRPTGPSTPICGETCADLGMVGHYPNCYYPQFLNWPYTLGGNLLQARLGAYRAVNGRTITQAQYNNMLNLHYQYNGVLGVSQTQINECSRLQYIEGALYTAPSSQIYSVTENWASSNGVDPNIMGEMLSAVTPDLIGFAGPSNQSLQQQIMSLPNYQAWDNLEGFIYAQTSNVTVQSGICRLASSLNTPQGMLADAETLAYTGGLLVAGGESIGGAGGGAIAQVGGDMLGAAGLLWVVGKMCEY